jgi:hypothetical protein
VLAAEYTAGHSDRFGRKCNPYNCLVARVKLLTLHGLSPVTETVDEPFSSYAKGAQDEPTYPPGGHWDNCGNRRPLVGMMSAAEVFVRTRRLHSVICAKLNHSGSERCIFRCGYMTQAAMNAAD